LIAGAKAHRRRDGIAFGVAAGLLAASAFGQPGESIFHIPSEPLADALNDFAVQANVSIGYSGLDFKGAVANPVDGRLSARQALERLLAGTGFEFVAVDGETISIHQTVATLVPAPEPPPMIEEITVTSTRRAEVAQTVPYSLAAVSGSDVKTFGITDTSGLAPHVAALSATDLGAGLNKLAIRGLSDSVIPGRSQSMVGLYLDEARLTDDAPDPGLRLLDIDRIEVVRGPRGTLYGAGTLGGLVRVITNAPRLDQFEGAASLSTAATQSGAPSGGIDLLLNAPIVSDTLAFRGVGYVQRDGGYINEIALHRPHANGTDTNGARMTLLGQVSDRWAVTVALTGQEIRAADSQYFLGGLPYLESSSQEPELHRDQLLQGSVTIEGELDWAKLTSAATFTDRRIAQQYDATPTWSALTGFPTKPATFDSIRDIQSISEETRLVSQNDGSFTWIVGAFRSHRVEGYKARLVGLDSADQFYVARSQTRDDYADEIAVFGEATYRITDSVSLTLGGREFYSDTDAAAEVSRPNSTVANLAEGRNHAPGFVPKLILSYSPTKALLFYVDGAEGFRLGGVNINSPSGAININRPRSDGRPSSANARTFDSDKLWTYELGAKTKLWDGRLVVNAAGFFTVWDGIQSDQVLRDGSLFTANAGSAHIPGVELEATLLATRNLKIDGNFFWEDPEILNPNPFLIQTTGRLPGAPTNTAGITGRYGFTPFDGWEAYSLLEYRFVGSESIGFDARNSPSVAGYSRVDARLGLGWGRWQGALYVDNLTDERQSVFGYGSPFIPTTVTQITPLRPRTVGLNLSYAY
jgi:outer membrane receptor protein involved in Fe transport